MTKIFFDINNLPEIKNPVVTIGTFDGVHKGHCKIIEQIKNEAKKRNGESVIVTFVQHPRNVIKQSDTVFLLNDLQEKIALIEKQQVDNLIIIDFSETFFSQTATEYIEKFLVKKIHPSCIIIGYDHKFGKDRNGNYLMLETFGKKFGFDVMEIDAETVKDVTVSSTKIRHALAEGKIKEANDLLGYHYFFSGIVAEGNKLGRTIGFPTANLEIENPHKLIPANGVYAVKVYLDSDKNKKWQGMMNIGFRPTFNGKKQTIEVNLFDFDKDIYGEKLTVEVIAFIRCEQKFSGIEALKTQLKQDKKSALALL